MTAAWLTPARLWRFGVVVAVGMAIAFVVFVVTADGVQALAGGRLGGDWAAFFSAGVLARTDPSGILDAGVQASLQAPYLAGRFAPFPYPPVLAWLFAPLSLLGFTGGYVVYVLLLIVAGVVGVRACLDVLGVDDPAWRRVGTVGAMTVAPMLRSIGGAQNATVTLLLLAVGVRQLQRDRPISAGVVFGLLWFKPQYAIPVAALLLVSRRWWRAGAVALLPGAVLWIANAVVFGTEWTQVWWRQIIAVTDVGNRVFNTALTVSPVEWLRGVVAVSDPVALGVAAAIGLGFAIAVFVDPRPVTLLVLLPAALLLTAPHALAYELVVLIPVVGAGLVVRGRAGLPVAVAIYLAAWVAVLEVPAWMRVAAVVAVVGWTLTAPLAEGWWHPGRRSVRILCVDLDPFLVGLVQRLRPRDRVQECSVQALGGTSGLRAGAVVMSGASDGIHAVRGTPVAARTVLVVGDTVAGTLVEHPGPVVRRPVDPARLRAALAQTRPPGLFGPAQARLRGLAATSTPDEAFGAIRLAAVLAAVSLALAASGSRPSVALVIAGWAVARVAARSLSEVAVALDVVVAAAVIVVTGGPQSPYVLVGAVVAAEVGYALPARAGAIAIGVATLAGLGPLLRDLETQTGAVRDLVTWGSVLPLAGLTGVYARRVTRRRDDDDLRPLRELRTTLDRLSRQADASGHPLERASAAEQALAAMTGPGVVAAAVLLGEGQVLDVAATTGFTESLPPRVVVDLTRPSSLPAGLTGLVPAGASVVMPIRGGGVDLGRLVAIVGPEADLQAVTARLHTLAHRTAVQLDSARLFDEIRTTTLDAERARLARDLHDGVVQTLVHVAFELGLMGSSLDGDVAEQVGHLRTLVARTSEEVRATVYDLRSPWLADGLGPALRSLAREHRDGVQIEVETDPVDALSPEAEMALLRIGQEAVSNAVQHGQARHVSVRLWQSADAVHLEVLDDGSGIGPDDRAPIGAHGVGLKAMAERAELLGADLCIADVEGGGTQVRVDLPHQADAHD